MSKEGRVYILWAESTKRYKIGSTYKLEERLRTLADQCPFPLVCVGLVRTEDRWSGEALMHQTFSRYRVYNEWYEFDETTLESARQSLWSLGIGLPHGMRSVARQTVLSDISGDPKEPEPLRLRPDRSYALRGSPVYVSVTQEMYDWIVSHRKRYNVTMGKIIAAMLSKSRELGTDHWPLNGHHDTRRDPRRQRVGD